MNPTSASENLATIKRMMDLPTRTQAQIPGNLPESARNWLTWALDPFHDTVVDACGIPDESSQQVITSVTKGQITVKRPASIPAGTAWAFHVFQTPYLESVFGFYGFGGKQSFRQANSAGVSIPTFSTTEAVVVGTDARGNGAIQSGFITVISGPNNVALSLSEYDPNTMEIQCFYVDDMTRLRLGAAGVEVLNTTAELYKGGSVTSYRVPTAITPNEVLSLWFGTGQALPPVNGAAALPPWAVPVITDCFTDVPGTPEAAIDYQTSSSWEAVLGAYMICPIDPTMKFENPHVRRFVALSGMSAITGTPNRVSFDASWNVAGGSAIIGGGGPTQDIMHSLSRRGVQARHTMACDRVGCHFRGLHSDSTFLINIRAMEEIAPVIGDDDGQRLVTLTRKAPVACPQAIELYQRVSRSMPAAVPRSLNPNGEWWDLIVSKMRQALPVLAPMARLLHPVAGAAVDVLAKAVQKREARATKAEVKKDVKRIEQNRHVPKTKVTVRAPSRAKSATR